MKEIMSYITEDESISIRSQYELIAVNRSTVYYEPIGESEEHDKPLSRVEPDLFMLI